jgi:hypothetical protein
MGSTSGEPIKQRVREEDVGAGFLWAFVVTELEKLSAAPR